MGERSGSICAKLFLYFWNKNNLKQMKTAFIFLVSLIFSIGAFGQQLIKVVDADDNTPLYGAYIEYDGALLSTDENGEVILQIDDFPIEITFSYVGYKPYVLMAKSPRDIPPVIKMKDNTFSVVTVTASKYEKRISESTVSVDVLKPNLITNTNTLTIDDALDKVSGVQMVGGQANIRGGSGFSYGAGSRVMLLIDNMPALQMDAGFPNWSDIPVENIDQVEIVKGAASALYGSAAMNGIINIRTGTPGLTPQTHLAASYLTYDTPKDHTKKWWGDTTRYAATFSAVHKQKFGKLDVVASGFYLREESFNKDTYTKRGRGSLKLKYRLSDFLFLGINTLYNKGNNGDFFLWKYGDSLALQGFEGTQATHLTTRYFIDPSLNFTDKYGNIHRLVTRYHNITNQNSGNQSNHSETYFGEYQFQRKLEKSGLLITTGILGSTTNTDSQLTNDTTFTTNVFASYIQLEKKIFEKLSLSGGMRYEYNQQLTPTLFNGIQIPNGKIQAQNTIFRFGASYEYMPYSSLRASWGQGFRFPTITERFISTSFGVFNIRSNPHLREESGWTAEIGVKQAVKLGRFKGYFDLAGFRSRYFDMMEFVFGLSIDDGASFTSQNVGDTQIDGFEIGFFGSYEVGAVKINGFGGYTYINPVYRNFEGNDTLINSLSANVNVLKYRSKHSFKLDIQADYKNWSFGTSINRASHMINIDAVLEGRGIAFGNDFDIIGLKAYREKNNSGFLVIDTRLSYKWKNLKTSFLIKNLTNQEYTIRPALLEAPRSFGIRLDYDF